MNELDHMGLVIQKGFHGNVPFLIWGYHGGSFRWLPKWLRRLIVKIWNRTVCIIWGHSWFPDLQNAEWDYQIGSPPRLVKTNQEICMSCCDKRSI